jgi:hypothetical protein
MEKLASLIRRIQDAGFTAETNLTDVILKITEEIGEVAAEDLRVRGIKPKDKEKNPIIERKEESCDVLLATLDLVLRQMTVEEMERILEIKFEKWLSYRKNSDDDSSQLKMF